MKVQFEYHGNSEETPDGEVIPAYEDTSEYYPVRSKYMPHEFPLPVEVEPVENTNPRCGDCGQPLPCQHGDGRQTFGH